MSLSPMGGRGLVISTLRRLSFGSCDGSDDGNRPHFLGTVFGILVIEALARIPGITVIAHVRIPTRDFEHAGQVYQIPSHDRCITLREFIVKTDWLTVNLIAIGGARASFADPAAVRLRRNSNADVAHGVVDGHCAVFDTVLIAGNDGPADLAVENTLPLVIQDAGHGV